ncbi:MAG: hypothetical protein MUF72_05405 [Elainella sp. Prado103]|jgi:hypothetical protein|nr:hypothetical protein [Elainella sp. Prado103]
MQWRFMAFYGGTLAIVIILFRAVTAYGEANLTLPPTLNPVYLSTGSPPGCSNQSRLRLNIQQSGIYLNGALSVQPESDPTSNPALRTERMTLIGRWQIDRWQIDRWQNEINLTGRTTAFVDCSVSWIDPHQPVTVQTILHPDKSLSGQIQQANFSWQFQAQPWPVDTPQPQLPH